MSLIKELVRNIYLLKKKKDDFFKRQIKSPVVKKINFLKTLFGEDDFY